MDLGFTTAVYVVAAILFILSLGGLSGQESEKRAVWYGIFGYGVGGLGDRYRPRGWLVAANGCFGRDWRIDWLSACVKS